MVRRIFSLMIILVCLNTYGKQGMKIGFTSDHILYRISNYHHEALRHQKDTAYITLKSKYELHVRKRNSLLMIIPSMFPISRGERDFCGESITDVCMAKGSVKTTNLKLNTGNIPHKKEVISLIKNFYFPQIYKETIYNGFLLSPCNYHNKRLYKYNYKNIKGRFVEMSFSPKISNTQLISGKAIVDYNSGKIISIQFSGIIDMIKFNARISMNDEEYSLTPSSCYIESYFSFVGNKIEGCYELKYESSVQNEELNTVYKKSENLNNKANENVNKSDGEINIEGEKLKPQSNVETNILSKECKTLFNEETKIRDKKYEIQSNGETNIEDEKYEANADTLGKKSSEDTIIAVEKKSIFNSFGDYFLDRINGKFGKNERGTYNVSPLINPLYLGYSSKKGVTYRMKLSTGYKFSPTTQLSLNARFGYSFKQKQFYTNIPVKLTLGNTLSIETEFGIGNRTSDSEILDRIKHESYDSIRWEKMNLNYFKDMYWRLRTDIRLGDRWNVKPGIIYHKRTAVDKTGFIMGNKPVRYYSFSPTLQLQFVPLKTHGPVFTIDYERGIKGVMKSSMDYERFETDFSWKKKLYGFQQLSVKAGYGMYISRGKNSYFLDYNNFRYENIPGGWEDDWTGEFQLLSSNWYNASKYYVRNNVTYDAPLLLLSRVPYLGKFLEMERLYMNILVTDKLYPYIEYGYGFTNRLFSAGLFCATSNKRYEGMGVRVSLELFKDW